MGAYQLGRFTATIELFEELVRRGDAAQMDFRFACLSSVAQGDCVIPNSCLNYIDKNSGALAGFVDNRPVEAIWIAIAESNTIEQSQIEQVEKLLQSAECQLWILPTEHPAPLLHIAERLVSCSSRLDLAIRLVCCCLGWRYVYRRIDDLYALAKLLNQLKAPRLFWSRLGSLYFDFACLQSCDAAIALNVLEKQITNGKVAASNFQDHTREVRSEEEKFLQFCVENGFPEQGTVDGLLHEAFAIEGSEYYPREQSVGDKTYIQSEPTAWLAPELFEMRHPWFRLLEKTEQNFLINGDSWFIGCVTDDFSAACAQWWRCVESVLRRKLVAPLGSLLDANPKWLDADRRFANGLPKEEEMNWESLFVRVLPDELRRHKMSLGHMLMLIEKCMSDCRKHKRSDSQIRRHCVDYVSKNLSAFRWIKSELDEVADMRSMFSPNVLSSSVIQKFRNEASHDKPMNYTDAVVGRLIAIRILDFMHYPRYCVTKKLEELKAELRDSNETSKS